MTFPFNIYLPALLAPCVLAFALLPLWARWCVWRDLVDEPGHRKDHGHVTPLAGGLTVFSALAITALAGAAVILLRAGDATTGLAMSHGLSRRVMVSDFGSLHRKPDRAGVTLADMISRLIVLVLATAFALAFASAPASCAPEALPTVAKTFNPASIVLGDASTLTITLTNPNAVIVTLTADLVDTLQPLLP